MKPITTILIMIGVLLVITIPFYIMDGFLPTKPLFTKEIKNDSACYIRVDNHFTIRYEEEIMDNIFKDDYSKWVLYKNGVRTNIYCYASMCGSKYDVVKITLRFYLRPIKSPSKIKKVYKLCK
jgi:hypothetical protein